jgi:hypothetical protein
VQDGLFLDPSPVPRLSIKNGNFESDGAPVTVTWPLIWMILHLGVIRFGRSKSCPLCETCMQTVLLQLTFTATVRSPESMIRFHNATFTTNLSAGPSHPDF